MANSGTMTSGHTSNRPKNGERTRTAVVERSTSSRSAISARSRPSAADVAREARFLENASPGFTSVADLHTVGVVSREATTGRAGIRRRDGESPPAAVDWGGHFETEGKSEGVEHTGHHERDDRERPGRERCSAGVATNSCPIEHTQTRYTSPAGGICESTRSWFRSGRYCSTSTVNGAQASRNRPTGLGISSPVTRRRRLHHWSTLCGTPRR